MADNSDRNGRDRIRVELKGSRDTGNQSGGSHKGGEGTERRHARGVRDAELRHLQTLESAVRMQASILIKQRNVFNGLQETENGLRETFDKLKTSIEEWRDFVKQESEGDKKDDSGWAVKLPKRRERIRNSFGQRGF